MKDKYRTCIVGILRGNFRHKRYCNYPRRDSIINPERLVIFISRVAMSRQLGSKNKEEVPPELAMSEAERLDYIAALIIELLEDEVAQEGAQHATASK